MNKVKYCLWTGGWDSTYMLINLIKDNFVVQPIYVVDNNRPGHVNEEMAMNTIFDKIKNSSFYNDNLLDIIKVNLNDIKVSDDINKSYEMIKNKIYIGTQYAWLSELSKKYNPLYIGIEKPSGEYSGCVEAINQFGKLNIKDKVIDKNASSKELVTLMGNFVFPIIDITENEMRNNVLEYKYDNIMKHIWFCHSPIKNTPCGMCRPCQQKMECNMQYLLPQKSQKRYSRFKFVEKIFGERFSKVYRKIVLKIKNVI